MKAPKKKGPVAHIDSTMPLHLKFGPTVVPPLPPVRCFRQQLSEAAQNYLWSVQESRSYAPRTRIFAMGEDPEGIFLIESGEVSLWLERNSTYPLLLRTASSGEVLGLSACVSGHTYEATAIAVSPCEVAFIPADKLARMVERFPESAIAISEFLNSQLNAAYDHVMSMRSARCEHKQ